jgi:hypothetical protein
VKSSHKPPILAFNAIFATYWCSFVMPWCKHYYENGVQFTSLNHHGTLKMKWVHSNLVISPWLKLFHYNITM